MTVSERAAQAIHELEASKQAWRGLVTMPALTEAQDRTIGVMRDLQAERETLLAALRDVDSLLWMELQTPTDIWPSHVQKARDLIVAALASVGGET